MNILATRNRLPDLTEAAERASKWVDLARPIIKAMFALEEVENDLRQQAYRSDSKRDQQTYRWVAEDVAKPQRALFSMLDGIRDDYLCDECPQQPSQFADEQAWADRDEWNDALAESVTTVEQAINIVTAEHNRSFAL
jgi:uncharacterized protein YfaT (DUF1175 family)